ncbi:MAG: hypothetical protein WBF66_12995 [Dehalococcoidia bacterium]
MAEPVLAQIKNGWAARGNGWAVHAPSQEEAIRKFEEAERRHKEIDARLFFYERIKKLDSAQL